MSCGSGICREHDRYLIGIIAFSTLLYRGFALFDKAGMAGRFQIFVNGPFIVCLQIVTSLFTIGPLGWGNIGSQGQREPCRGSRRAEHPYTDTFHFSLLSSLLQSRSLSGGRLCTFPVAPPRETYKAAYLRYCVLTENCGMMGSKPKTRRHRRAEKYPAL